MGNETYRSQSNVLVPRRLTAAILSLTAAMGVAEVARGNTANDPQATARVSSAAESLYGAGRPDSLPANNSQASLNAFGGEQVNAIPGFSMDFRQTTLGVSPQEGSTVVDFACPETGNASRIPIDSIEVHPGNQADVNFCPTMDEIQVTKPNTNDPTYQSALSGYLTDPLRNAPWGGDEYQEDNNLYYECPLEPKQQNPRFRVRYSRKAGIVKAVFDGSNASKYCNEVGMETDRVTAQVVETDRRGKRHYKNIGRSVLVIEGLNMPLVYGYGLSQKQIRIRTNISEVGDICDEPRSKNIKSVGIRVKVKEKFTANHAQTFVHDHHGGMTPLRSSSKTYKSSVKDIC